MKKAVNIGIASLLFGLCLLFAGPEPSALAASAEWRLLPGRIQRERLIISYGASEGQPGRPVRNSRESVLVPWAGPLPALNAPAVPASALLLGLTPTPEGLLLSLRDPAFAFVAVSPQAGLLHLDIFKDPLGARWTGAAPAYPREPDPAESAASTPSSSGGAAASQTASPAGPTGAAPSVPDPAPGLSPTLPAEGATAPEGAKPGPGADDAYQVREPLRPAGGASQPASPGLSGSATAESAPAGPASPAGPGSASGPAETSFPDILAPGPDGPGGQTAPVTRIFGVREEDGAVEESPGPTSGVYRDSGAAALPISSGSSSASPALRDPRPALTPESTLPPLPERKDSPFSRPGASSPRSDAAAAPGSAPGSNPGSSLAPARDASGPAPGSTPGPVPGGASGRERPGLTSPIQTPSQVPAPAPLQAPARPLISGGSALPPLELEEDDEIRLPEWPPLRMPDRLPELAPPAAPGPYSGIILPRSTPLLRAAPAFLAFFQADTAMAAQAGQPGYDIIDAPFIYRLRLSDDATAAPERVPVYVRVPPGTAGADAPGTSPAPAASEAGGQSSGQAAGQSGSGSATGAGARASAETPASASGQLPQGTAGTAQVPQGTVGGAQLPQAAPGSAQAPQGGDGSARQTADSAGSGAESGPDGASAAAPAPAGPQLRYPEPLVKGQSSAQGSQTWVQSTQPTDEAGKTVVYVDEEGNPLPPPVEPASASMTLEQFISEGAFKDAIDLANQVMRQDNLSPEQREYFLHRRADATFSLHRDNPVQFFTDIAETSEQAINFNTRSTRNAAAYLRLGYLNLQAGNAYEAEGYFTVLRTQFPKDDSIPLSYYYMGDYQYQQGNLNDAMLQFLHVVQQYPDSRYSRDAALGLTRTMYRQGYYDKAYEVIDYVEKRWPRYYLDYPPMLSMLGDTAYRSRHLDRARQAYWLYYNLVPEAPDADIVLARLGDIYFAQKNRDAAVHVYEEAARNFPGKDGGIIAMMRLAENSINDEPTLARMYRVFQQPYNLRQAETYRKIIREWPESPLMPLAKLKLAMWSLWQKDFETCFRLCNEIVMAGPDSPLAARALEVSRNAFALLAADSVNSKRYDRVRDAWDRYPILHAQEEFLDPESRLALAVSQWEAQDPDGALHTIEPFFLGSKIPEYSEMALLLALNIFVQNDRWEDVLDMAQRVELWELTPETRRQMDYALGLTYESQGRPEEAMPIWKSLYEQNALPPSQQAYAEYFLARSAQKEEDLETAYLVGQDALERMKELASLNPEEADTEKIKNLLVSLMDISQSAGMLQESLNYAQEYLQTAEPGSDDYLSVMYNMAGMYRSRGSMGEWEKILNELVEKYPQSYFGRAAATQLNMYKMNRNAAQFAPGTGG